MCAPGSATLLGRTERRAASVHSGKGESCDHTLLSLGTHLMTRRYTCVCSVYTPEWRKDQNTDEHPDVPRSACHGARRDASGGRGGEASSTAGATRPQVSSASMCPASFCSASFCVFLLERYVRANAPETAQAPSVQQQFPHDPKNGQEGEPRARKLVGGPPASGSIASARMTRWSMCPANAP